MAVLASDVFPGVSGAPRVVPLTHVTGPTLSARISERKTAAKRSSGQQGRHGRSSWLKPRKASMSARPRGLRSRTHRSGIRVWPSTRCSGQRGWIPTAARRFHKGMSSVPWVCFHIATTEPFNKGKLQMHTHMLRRSVRPGKCTIAAPVWRPLQIAAKAAPEDQRSLPQGVIGAALRSARPTADSDCASSPTLRSARPESRLS